MLKQQIAEKLEIAFSQYGFAEPSVAKLKTACQVSLRTLYKYYPSKEIMIVAALEYRHQRYLSFLLDDSPAMGLQSILHIFEKLELWMKKYAPHGCLSMNAISAFPDNTLIIEAVKQHKIDVRQLLGKYSLRKDLATELFLLHEGVSTAWPLLGSASITSAKKTLLQLMEKH